VMITPIPAAMRFIRSELLGVIEHLPALARGWHQMLGFLSRVY
jgi:hypothetical protein